MNAVSEGEKSEVEELYLKEMVYVATIDAA